MYMLLVGNLSAALAFGFAALAHEREPAVFVVCQEVGSIETEGFRIPDPGRGLNWSERKFLARTQPYRVETPRRNGDKHRLCKGQLKSFPHGFRGFVRRVQHRF